VKTWKWKTLPCVALSFMYLVALSQNPTSQPCSFEPPVFASSAPNIFNDKQEQDLGDALGEYFESSMRIAPPAPDDQLTRIGERLLAALPHTGVHYRFRIYDSGEVNGFSLAGGRVYISRKLIATVKTEDELAGVIAHEIGHISTRQTAIQITRLFRIRLGITQVTDRADIFAKVHQMLSTPAKPQEEEQREEKDQLVADRVGLFTMVRAGYAAESYSSFFDRISVNKGKTGDWLSDFFGLTNEESQRYRSALKLIAALPAGCKGRQPEASPSFIVWQHNTVEERVKSVAAGIEAERTIKLDPPLRPSPWRVRFSLDGRFVLAQDEGSIFVADKATASNLFRIDAPDAEAAYFTPDSGSVIFHDKKLRLERWSVSTGQRTSVKEMVVYEGCSQTLLSPDGKTLVCVNLDPRKDYPKIGLRLIDVESGQPFFDKPAFYEMNSLTSDLQVFELELEEILGAKLATIIVSPDERYLIVAVMASVLVYDLENRKPVDVGGKLRGLTQSRMSFLGPDELYVVGMSKGNGMYDAEILSFPSGQPIKKVQIGDQQLDSVTKGRLLLVRPLKNFAVAVLDPEQAKILFASKFPALDMWDNSLAVEDLSGGIAVGQVGVQGSKSIALPLGPLPLPRAALFSPDGRFLAISLKSRAAIWNLETGKQIGLMRPFRSAWMDENNHLFAQLPKYLSWDAKEMQFTLAPLEGTNLADLDDAETQYHDFEIRLKPMGKDKAATHHATLEVKKMQTQVVAWTRDYPHEAPAIWAAEDDRLVLAWLLNTEAAKFEIRNFPHLQRQVDALKNQKKGILLETVVPATGAPLQQIIIPETDTRQAFVSGDFALARGGHDSTVIYRLDSGAQVGEFFGSPVATDAGTGIIAAINRENEILLLNAHDGRELQRFTLGSPVRLARIVTGREKTLLILTADQIVHRLPLPQ
jgi:hypothetical protein